MGIGAAVLKPQLPPARAARHFRMAAEVDVTLTPLPLVPELGFLPAGSVLLSYGGGDALCNARQLLHVSVPAAQGSLHCHPVVQRVAAAISAALAADMPDFVEVDRDMPCGVGGIEWRARILVTSHVYGADCATGGHWNFAPHGFLFSDAVGEVPTKWPLVGVFDPVGLEAAGEEGGIGVNALAPADVHVHAEDDGVHFGSDMAALRVNGSDGSVRWGWFGVCDTHTRTCEVSLVFVVPPDLEGEFDAALASAAVASGRADDVEDGGAVSVRALLTCLARLLPPPALEALTSFTSVAKKLT